MGKIVAIDLFSGAGGTTSGLKKSGIDVQVAVEIDSVAVKTYKLNNPEVSVIDMEYIKLQFYKLYMVLQPIKVCLNIGLVQMLIK